MMLDERIAQATGWVEIEDGPFVRIDYPRGGWILAPAQWKSPDGKLHIDLPCWSTDPALALGLLKEMDATLCWNVDVQKWQVWDQYDYHGYYQDDDILIFDVDPCHAIAQAWLEWNELQ